MQPFIEKAKGDWNVSLIPLAYHLVLLTYNSKLLFESAGICNNLACLIFETSSLHKYSLFAFCIMPDHVHILCQPGDVLVSHFVNLLRFRFEYVLTKSGHIGPVWQPDFREQPLPEDEIKNTAVFVFENPVRNGLVKDAFDYPFSFVIGGKEYRP